MKRKKLIIMILLMILYSVMNVQGQKPGKIVFISEKTYQESDNEIKAAFDFLKGQNKYDADFVVLKNLDKHPEMLRNYSFMWIHHLDFSPFMIKDKKLCSAINKWVENGGRLILSLESIHMLVPLGYEKNSPYDSIKNVIDDGYGRRLGLHSFIDHPVFCGQYGGAYLLRPVVDTSVKISGYFGKNIPAGKVVAVDWDYIFLREDSKLMMEYNRGKGVVTGIGAYMNFSLPNYNRLHLKVFTENVFSYLSGNNCSIESNYWDYSLPKVSGCISNPQENDQMLRVPPASLKWQLKENDPMAIDVSAAGENFWDLAGERILMMGKEKGGISEIWVNPLMVLRDYEAGIIFGYSDSIYMLNDQKPAVEVHPGYFSRTYKFPRAYLKEIIVNDPSEPAGVVHYEYEGVYEAKLILKYKSNMRLMWPYSENTTGSLCYYWNNDLDAQMITNNKGMVMAGANRKADFHLAGQYDDFIYSGKTFSGKAGNENLVSGLLQYNLKMTDKIDVIITAGETGVSLFRSIAANPLQIFENAGAHADSVLSQRLMITTPDVNFNKGYRWASLATDRFFVNTPGMGKSLVAGYSTTERGWNGGHKINGRPGYGWYFGRDGEWSGLALLDEGDFGKVKLMLQFFQKYQDLSGKIFHEATTSGVIHYDAADATPLYIVLWGKYFRYTNDTVFLRESWPDIKKAIDFCFSTDTDMDHLIENTNVGHGWVEGGELYGSHSTLYLSGCWAAALNEAFTMATSLNLPEADSYRTEANIVTSIINQKFWNTKTNFYSYGINKDHSFRTEPTILPAVPLYFRLADKLKAASVLKQYASNAFSTNWGTRIVREDSKLFKPAGYHYGSVWPLFTGWTSLAEFAYGNNVQGFTHLMDNLNVYKYWGHGFVEEVLNGAVYEPSGVCPHQCWSETMVLQPSIEGLLGIDVNSSENMFHLALHQPADWDSLSVDNLRMDSRTFSMKMLRKENSYFYTFSPSFSGKMMIEFMPDLPSGTKILSANLNGKPASLTSFTTPRNLAVFTNISLSSKVTLELTVEKGISVLPVLHDPKPGYHAEGARILSYGLTGNVYTAEVEGPSESSATIDFYVNGYEIAGIENARQVAFNGKRLTLEVLFEKSNEKYTTKKISINLK